MVNHAIDGTTYIDQPIPAHPVKMAVIQSDPGTGTARTSYLNNSTNPCRAPCANLESNSSNPNRFPCHWSHCNSWNITCCVIENDGLIVESLINRINGGLSNYCDAFGNRNT